MNLKRNHLVLGAYLIFAPCLPYLYGSADSLIIFFQTLFSCFYHGLSCHLDFAKSLLSSSYRPQTQFFPVFVLSAWKCRVFSFTGKLLSLLPITPVFSRVIFICIHCCVSVLIGWLQPSHILPEVIGCYLLLQGCRSGWFRLFRSRLR